MSSNSTSYAPPGEDSSDLWLERSNFSGAFLGGVAYGIHVAVFSATLYFMTRKSSGQSKPLLVFVCALFTLGTITIACNTKFSEQMWIDDRNIPGGPIAWLETHYSDPVNTLGNAAYIFANFLADGVLLSRLWVVWHYNYFIMVIPVLAYLGSTGYFFEAMSILTIFQSAQPGASLWTHTTVSFAVPYWSLSLSLNLVVTLLITTRLLMMRSKVIEVLGPEHSKTYTSVAAMMIESAAPYSVTGLIFIICYARNSFVQNLVLPVLGQIMCISPELIILRVSLGRAWSRDTTLHTKGSLPRMNQGGRFGSTPNKRSGLSDGSTARDISFGGGSDVELSFTTIKHEGGHAV
ncbi:hypothetical protein BD410DRAFT_833964 [Rickenella mellea]|uniref:Uncharacterized protein n=1 Tax=Rickenella mellea TaxID=50990 RepID=A0A4R5XEX3_9AGAM|nr:hypothetical protein BD410DRAFT_833964 [Rickenella mellea]